MSTASESDLKTYWCHECDMSVSLTPSPSPSPSPSPLLCPHCNTNFLELMDSPFPLNDAASPLFPSLFDSPFLHQFIFTTNPNDTVFENGNQDPLLSLLSPPTLTTSKSKPRAADTVPIIIVTSSLLSRLDPNGVVLCAVCKDDVSVDEEAKILPCNHLYHSDCITPWLVNHDSCPVCRFRLAAKEGEEGDHGGDGLGIGEIRRQLRAAMARLSELMEEEEEDDFYGLRSTLNNIASRHGVVHEEVEDSDGSGLSDESVIVNGGGEQLP